LVNHLGINRASLYDTYGDKEQLFFKALEHYRKGNTEGVAEFLDETPNVKEAFKQLFEQAIDEAIKDADKKGCFMVNTTTELIPGDERVLSVLLENKASFEALFYKYLKKGETDGQFSKGKDLKALATFFFTLYNGLRVVSKMQPNPKELRNTARVALQLLD
jgi:TetR/AcrR family transcriptional repressor of nem operon